MMQYVIINTHKYGILTRGETPQYTDPVSLIPSGYKYIWAYSSPGFLTVNVEPTLTMIRAPEVPEPKSTLIQITRKVDDLELFRMDM